MKMRYLVVISMVLFAMVQSAEAQKEKKVRRDARHITADEIAEKTNPQNALDLIRALRPAWLTSRGPTSIMLQDNGISVYVDGSRRGSVEELRLINRESVEEMRYFSASEAQGRFGMDNVGGVIEVTTKKG